MSYYNNRGGFRNNNNYNNSNSNNNFHNNHHFGNGFNNGPRINETQVPQSKHTIFIRGLHGDTTTEEIKEYIGDKVGRISFDFVKMSPDGTKIFVAVRFEKREEAKEFMETYSDREFMGCRCELSWFRDIRRYCAYQRAKQVRSSSQRRRHRSDSEEEEKRSPSPIRRRSSNRSRSNSKSESRRSTTRSRSSTRSRSASEKRRTRSESRNSRVSRSRSRSSSSRRSESRRSVSSEAESRVSSRNQSREDNRQKRRRESSSSARDSVAKEIKEEEKPIPKKKVKEHLPKIPLPPKAISVKTSPESTVFIPPPSVDMELESPPQHVSTNPYATSYQQPSQVAYSMPMDQESPPKVIVRESSAPYCPPATLPAPVLPPVAMPTPPPAQQPPPPPPQPAFIPRQIGKIEILMPASLPAVAMTTQAPPPSSSQLPLGSSSSVNNGTMLQDNAQLPTTNKLFGHLKAFQSALLSTVKFEKKEEDDGLSGLRLSTMAGEEDNEEVKAMEREQKLAKLNDEQMMRFHIKKKQFETAFRNDCETYAVVTRALLAKDESLQFGLKMSLLENMEDLYKRMMQRVDDHLDALLN